VLLGLGVALIAAAIYGVNYYFSDVPDKLADDYRLKAQKAIDRMTDDMDQVYRAFDEYLADSVRPRSYYENANDLDELRRRVLPVIEDTEEALVAAERRITKARKSVKAERDTIHDTPSSWMLDDSDALKEVDAAVKRSDAYARSTEPYLKSFERFIRYEKEQLDIARRSWEPRPIDGLGADTSLETFKSAVSEELTFFNGLRVRLLDLDPHPDTEDQHGLAVESMTVMVDYYEDLQTAFEALSISGLEQADRDLLAAAKRLRDKGSSLYLEFAASSSLQKQSRDLGQRGDALEDRIAALGTGDGEAPGGDLYRRPAPPDPKPKSGGGGAESVS
jgi:hypothetical protein